MIEASPAIQSGNDERGIQQPSHAVEPVERPRDFGLVHSMRLRGRKQAAQNFEQGERRGIGSHRRIQKTAQLRHDTTWGAQGAIQYRDDQRIETIKPVATMFLRVISTLTRHIWK